MYSYNDVLAKFSSRNKDLHVDKYDVIDWCAEVIRSCGNLDYCNLYKNFELTIDKNKIAMLPCNFYKLDYVLINGKPMLADLFREKSRKLISFDEQYTNVTIDYYGTDLDDEGYPSIASEDLTEACYWYCLEMMMLDDFLMNKMSENKYRHIIDKKEVYMTEARSSMRMWSKNRQNRFNKLITNYSPKLNVPRQ